MFLHVVVALVLDPLWPWIMPEPDDSDIPPLQIVMLEPEVEEEEVEEPDPEIDWDGQLVEVAEPEEQIKPEDAEYLAEYDTVVPEEMRSERFRINPEVVAPEFSQDDVVRQEDIMDLNVTDESTGATVGNNRFDPQQDGNRAAIPSRWQVTNKEGPQDPVPSSAAEALISGAPSNDLLDEQVGPGTYLNTKEFKYAEYLNTIRRMVNFWWEHNLHNLPSGLPFSKPQYETVVEVTLNANGVMDEIVVLEESGIEAVDTALVDAWRMAGPFPPVPEGLLERDGRAYLPPMSFTLSIGQASNQYQGIDPRAGVQFPGILKSPR